MLNMRAFIGQGDVLFITLDSLRYDAAQRALEQGFTPYLATLLPEGRWEARHTPGNFTYAAHQAFFAGFLPTPLTPGRHARLFAARFAGSTSVARTTFVFPQATLPEALAARGYHTVCIGGVGFFNLQSPLGSVLPEFFTARYWRPSMGVNSPRSTEQQVRQALTILAALPRTQRLLLFMNISATHHPSRLFLPGALQDSVETQMAALAYVDTHLPPLFGALQQRGPSLVILCADHGTAFGEDGYYGHRLNHPVVLTVPYTVFLLPEGSPCV